jgi:DNA-binding winged helix-turn-helix (wHTH) protein
MELVDAPEGALQNQVPDRFVREFGAGEDVRLLSVDFAIGAVTVDNQRVRLTGKEFAVFALLVQQAGKTCTKRDFLDHLYGSAMDQPELKIIDVFICKLRHKLSAALNGHQPIGTVWGRGYRFGEPVVDSVLEEEQGQAPRRRVDFVIGPDGEPLMLYSLPPANTDRWVIWRKAQVVCAVRGGLLTKAETLSRYPSLTLSELDSWIALVDKHGMTGLRQTAVQRYTL